MFAKKQPFFSKPIWKFVSAGLTFVLLTAPVYGKGPQELIAVLDLESNTAISKNTIDTICNKIEELIAADKRYTDFDRKFLPFTLQSIGVQTPCSTVSCLSGLGRQIGAKYVVGGTMRLNKKEITITLHRIDAEKGVVIGSVTKKMPADKTIILHKKIPDIVMNLMKKNAPPPAEKGKKNFFTQPLVLIGGAAILAGAGVGIYYFLGPKTAAGGNGLSLDDAPQHTR